MARVTRASCPRSLRGGTAARTPDEKAISPARSPRRVATVVRAIAASMAWSRRGTSPTMPAISRPVSRSTTTGWLRSAR